MSAALAPYFTKLPLFKNLLIGSQITDETFGVAVQHAAQKWDGLCITSNVYRIICTSAYSSKPKLAIHLTVAIVAIILAYVSHLFMPDSIAVIIATLLAATIGVVIEKWK